MNKSIKDSINSRLSAVTAPENLAQIVIAQANRRKKRFYIPAKRIFAIAATFCLVIVLSVGVMAGSIPQLNSLFSVIGNKLSSLVQPIVQTCESNGIKMEVLAALNDDNAVIIYLTLQDLEQNRIDGTTNLNNLEISGITLPNAEIINFDEASRIATVKITGLNSSQLKGSKLSINLSTILSKQALSDYEFTGLTVADIERLNPTPQIYFPESLNESMYNYDTANPPVEALNKYDSHKMPHLMPEAFTLNIAGCSWTYLSGVGIIDNALHLQLNPNNTAGKYNRIEYALFDVNGVLLSDLYNVKSGFGKREEDGYFDYSDYYENVIVLPPDADYASLKLYSSKNEYEHQIKGNWSTTFVLQDNTQEKKAECIINMNPWEITEVSVSSIGVVLRGQGPMYEYSTYPEITVKRVDGSVIECNSTSSKFEIEPDGTERIVMQSMFNLPLDIKEIASVTINGIDIALK